MAPDVLLVQPPYRGPYNFWKAENLGMGYIASYLEAEGYEVDILDAFLLDLSVRETVQKIEENPPSLLLGFSLLSYELYSTGKEIINCLREDGFERHITIGSWFPTFWYKKIIEMGTKVDSIILGEGEASTAALVDYLKNGKWNLESDIPQRESYQGVLLLRPGETIQDLDSLPFPRRDYMPLVKQDYHLTTVYTSRGCAYGNCSFCSVSKFYGRDSGQRMRSPGNVIKEVETLAEDGVDFIFFADENFLGTSQEGSLRALKILEGIAESGISMRYTFNCTIGSVDEDLFARFAELGLSAVYIGVETIIDRMLKVFNKGYTCSEVRQKLEILKKLGIKLVPGWIMFERNTTLEEVKEQISFLQSINTYHVNYLKSLYVMKDTEMEKLYNEEVFRTYFYSKYFFKDPQVELLVRILQEDYLPTVMPYTKFIYPIWHKFLAGYGTSTQQQRYERINTKMRELSLGFTGEVIERISSNSLNNLASTLSDHKKQWEELGLEIQKLKNSLE